LFYKPEAQIMATITANVSPEFIAADINYNPLTIASSYASTISTSATFLFPSKSSTDGYLLKINGTGFPPPPLTIPSNTLKTALITSFEISRKSTPSTVLVSWQSDGRGVGLLDIITLPGGSPPCVSKVVASSKPPTRGPFHDP
jgi:hypothetical protein